MECHRQCVCQCSFLSLCLSFLHTHTHNFNIFVNLKDFDTVNMLIQKLSFFFFNYNRLLAHHPTFRVLLVLHASLHGTSVIVFFYLFNLIFTSMLTLFLSPSPGTKSGLRENFKSSSSILGDSTIGVVADNLILYHL